MSVVLTSPVAGLKAGDPYDGELQEWFIAEGYARREKPEGDVVYDVPADKDPRLAENQPEEPEAPTEAPEPEAEPEEHELETQTVPPEDAAE